MFLFYTTITVTLYRENSSYYFNLKLYSYLILHQLYIFTKIRIFIKLYMKYNYKEKSRSLSKIDNIFSRTWTDKV